MAAGAQPLPLPTTSNDFRLPGTQPLTVSARVRDAGSVHELPLELRRARGRALPQLAGLDDGAVRARPAQLGGASRSRTRTPTDSGETCLRCHLPKGWLEGRSAAADGTLMTADDRQGVQCSVCHRLVDPVAGPGAPAEDAAILAALGEPVPAPANAMMVVDPHDRRRGPFDVVADLGSDPHLPAATTLVSPFHRSAELCGTCHNVRNPVFTKNPMTGRYELNALDTPRRPDRGLPRADDLRRVGRERVRDDAASTRPSSAATSPSSPTCQDCHMPRVTGRDAKHGPCCARPPAPRHDRRQHLRADDHPAPSRCSAPRSTRSSSRPARNAPATCCDARRPLALALADGDAPVRVTNESGPQAADGLSRGPPHVAPGARLRRVAGASSSSRAATSSRRRPSSRTRRLHVWETQHGLDEELAARARAPRRRRASTSSSTTSS